MFGFAMTQILKRVINDQQQELNIIIVTVYFLFYVAEYSGLMVSGAIGLVSLGLYMSSYGKTVISPSSEKHVHNVWAFI